MIMLMGKTLLEAFPEVTGTALPTVLDEVYRSGQPFVAEEYPVTLTRTDGSLAETFFWTSNSRGLPGKRGIITKLKATKPRTNGPMISAKTMHLPKMLPINL